MDVTMDWRGEGEQAKQRLIGKVLGGFAAGMTAGSVMAVASGRPILRTTAAVATNAAAFMGVFGVTQEVVRAARSGQHDAWTSFIAGSLTGSLLLSAHAGRQYRLLGAACWGPLFGTAHWANNKLQPGQRFRTWLVYQGLLDEPLPGGDAAASASAASCSDCVSTPGALGLKQAQQLAQVSPNTGGQQQQQEGPLRTEDELTWREKVSFTERLKAKEVAELAARMEAEAQLRRQQRQQQQAGEDQQDAHHSVSDKGASGAEGCAPRSWWQWLTGRRPKVPSSDLGRPAGGG